ncbi:uncharacterized protein LOC127792413 isoform X2 [Diospyros lotus]|uniref:uncharacterized protein LOC127792413 isoform X2 n=1 Tax=Diospyros lotus TaxID=55363 RepID=UPI00224E922E|nr:uncharacterized protein LOC127792413 isoform X2 [Diospyros lotus]
MAADTKHPHYYSHSSHSNNWSQPSCLPTDLQHSQEVYNSSLLDHGSISFGRFAVESLSWEKWSVFSHNKRQEELEKFTAPGHVAQKKAYFEEYYKKIRAMKQLQAEQQERNASDPCEEEQSPTTEAKNNFITAQTKEDNKHCGADEIKFSENGTSTSKELLAQIGRDESLGSKQQNDKQNEYLTLQTIEEGHFTNKDATKFALSVESCSKTTMQGSVAYDAIKLRENKLKDQAGLYKTEGNPTLGGSKKLDCRTKKDVIKPAGKPDSSPHKDIGGKRDYLSKRATHKSASDMKSGKLPSCISKGKPAPSSTIMRGSLAKANSSLRDGLTNKNTLKEITGATPVRNRDSEKRRAPVGVTGKSLQLTGCHTNLRKGQSENQRPKSILAAWGKSTESLATEIGYNNHVRGVKQKQVVNASSGRVPKPASPVMPSIQKAPNLKQGHKIVSRQSGDLRSAQRNPRQMLPSWR